MVLNFGHTFAHIEVKNSFSKNITHGEAVLAGMILAIKLSIIKRCCDLNILREIKQIYKKIIWLILQKFSNTKIINSLIPFLKNDKKNDDDKVNFILLKKIGKTTSPNSSKISITNLKKLSKLITLD